MSAVAPLALIEAHLAEIDAVALSDTGVVPEPPDLSALVLDSSDLDRARALLVSLQAAGERLSGMQTRVRGEIEGMRRPRRESLRPAPRVLDTSA